MIAALSARGTALGSLYLFCPCITCRGNFYVIKSKMRRMRLAIICATMFTNNCTMIILLFPELSQVKHPHVRGEGVGAGFALIPTAETPP